MLQEGFGVYPPNSRRETRLPNTHCYAQAAYLFSPVGTISVFPREIRDKIYGHVLDFASPDQCSAAVSDDGEDYANESRTSLLQASKQIHSEAEIVLYQVNEFLICIDYDYCDAKDNKSVMGRQGYRIDFGLQLHFSKYGQESFMNSPPKPEMLKHMSFFHLTIGAHCGIKEFDIVPSKGQSIQGPERPAYRSLIETTENLCALLKTCHQIQILRISIRSIEKTPGSIKKVLDLLGRLRCINHTRPVVYAMEDDQFVHWNLKGSYGRYLNQIMAMPEGYAAPRYVGDAMEPNQNDRNIFDKVGGKWLGGRSFALPQVADDESTEGYDDTDNQMDEIHGVVCEEGTGRL